MKTCSVDNCTKLVKGRGFCSAHYAMWLKHGDPLKKGTNKKYGDNEKCRMDNCDDRIYGLGLCSKHYQRFRANGDPTISQTRRGESWVDFYGYEVKTVNGKSTLVHRYVMEQHLGRKLTSDEIVHHINEDKLDNRIGNLEIVTRSHHRGRIHAQNRDILNGRFIK